MRSRAGVVEDVCNGRGTMFCFAYTFKEKKSYYTSCNILIFWNLLQKERTEAGRDMNRGVISMFCAAYNFSNISI